MFLLDSSNFHVLFYAVSFAALTYLMSRGLQKDDNLVKYVEKSHALRLILILLPGIALGLFLTGITFWGVYLHLFEADFFGTTDITKRPTGKGLPIGTYSNIGLLALITSLCAFFSSISIFVLRSTFTGLKFRFGLAQRVVFKESAQSLPVKINRTKKKPKRRR
jgi:hypothetical protein